MMIRATKGLLARAPVRSVQVRFASTWGWESLAGAGMDKETVNDCQTLDSQIQQRLNLASSMPKKVEPIDWAHWGKEIKAEGVVDAIKKEYDSITYTNHTLSEVQDILDHNTGIVEDAKKKLPFYEHEIAAAKGKVAEYTRAKSASDNWSLQDWYNFLPGFEDMFRDEANRDEWANDSRTEAFENVDLKAALEAVKAGQLPNFPPPSKDMIGDVDPKEEAELKEKGEWSIARQFANKEQRDVLQQKVRQLMGRS